MSDYEYSKEKISSNIGEKTDREEVNNVNFRQTVIVTICFVIMCVTTFVLCDMQNKKAAQAERERTHETEEQTSR